MLINMGIHKHLGAGFLEIVYKDCLEYLCLCGNLFLCVSLADEIKKERPPQELRRPDH